MIYELIEGGRPPVTPRDGDAGYDVFARLNGAVTVNGATFMAPESASHITIPRFSTAVIPLGFRAALPKGYHADLRARSSWSSKGVHVSLGLIDEGYRGEWAAIVTPTCEGGVTIEHGAKIGQFVLRLTYIEDVIEGEVSTDTRRGEGGFGSTGFGAPTDHDCDNCDGIQPKTCINAPTLSPGDLVWWRGEWKVGEFRRYAEDEEQTAFRAPRAKVDFWDGEGWRFVLLEELSQPPPGRLMRLIRKGAGKTMGETARIMGVSVARLSGWETCQTEPPLGDDLTKWFEAIEPVSFDWLKAVRDYIYERRDQWMPPEPRPFAADTMRPDVSLPGEDPAQAEARARWMAAHHHAAGGDGWDESHPAPIGALRAYIDDENGRGLGYSDMHALLNEIEWLRHALWVATGEAEGRALVEIPKMAGFMGADRMMKAIRALRVDRDNLLRSERRADAEIDRLRPESDARVARIADAIGYDNESGMSIADRGAELLDGARKMETFFDSIALTLGLSQGLDEGHIDYVRRVAGSVRALRDEHEILKGRVDRQET